MTTMRERYLAFDRERAAAVAKRMRSTPMSVGGVLRELEQDGLAWLDELGGPRGVTAVDVIELVRLIDRDTAGLAEFGRRGIFTPAQLLEAGVGAGVGVGLIVGIDIGREVSS